jgi:hypothetical protein
MKDRKTTYKYLVMGASDHGHQTLVHLRCVDEEGSLILHNGDCLEELTLEVPLGKAAAFLGREACMTLEIL